MISKHCGQRLVNVYKEAIYTENCATKKRGPLHHVWVCRVCNMRFTQRVRVSKKKP